MRIINITQHNPSIEQVEAGVYNSPKHAEIKQLLTFDDPPSVEKMEDIALQLTKICLDEKAEAAMIGGAPFFMSILETELRRYSVKPLYAFSKRFVLEEDDGKKTSVFKHICFIDPTDD